MRRVRNPDIDDEQQETEDQTQENLRKKLFEQPGHLIRRLHQISTAIFLRESSKYDLTPLQYVALAMIDTFPGIDQRQLGRGAALDRQTTSTVVRRLEEKGLVVRQQKDRRTTALFVTGAGRALHQLMASRLGVVGETLLSPLTPEEQKTFFYVMTKMVTELNKLSRSPQGEVKVIPSEMRALPARRQRKRRRQTA